MSTKVVILCGGKGYRLREETEYRPKPMLPIGERPVLWHIMKTYAVQGFNDFILCLGYKGEMIKDFFRNYRWMTGDVTVQLGGRTPPQFHGKAGEEDWRVTMVDTGQETLTAGRIRQVFKYLEGEDTFFLTYGDGVGDIDIRRSLEVHRSHGKLLTLTAVHPPGRFGELAMNDERQVLQFNEKPQAEGGWINGGYFVVSTGIRPYLEGADQQMFEREPMQRLAQDGQLMANVHRGFWQPMDTYQEYTLLNKLWNEGGAPWKIW